MRWVIFLVVLTIGAGLQAATVRELGKVSLTTTSMAPMPGRVGGYYIADSSAGKFDCGEIRMLDNGASRTVFTFNGYNGKSPVALLTIGKTVYGITSSGGRNNDGVIFRLRGNGIQILAQFDDTSGPPQNLQAEGHTLCGATTQGIFTLKGHAFAFYPLQVAECATMLHGALYATRYIYIPSQLVRLDGATEDLIQTDFPLLIIRGRAVILGIDQYGGRYNSGRIMSYDPATNSSRTLVDFQSYNGGSPTAFAVLGNGTLYTGNSDGVWGIGRRPTKLASLNFVHQLGATGRTLYGIHGAYPYFAFEIDP